MSEFVTAMKTSELEPGDADTVEIDGREVAVFNIGGAFYAIDNACPHQEGPLADGPVSGRIVVCPLHHWEFDVTTGECFEDPSCPVATHEVRVQGEDVQIRVSGEPA